MIKAPVEQQSGITSTTTRGGTGYNLFESYLLTTFLEVRSLYCMQHIIGQI